MSHASFPRKPSCSVWLMNDELLKELLDEARRRYEAERAVHDHASAEFATWVTIAAAVLGGLAFLIPPTMNGWPHGCSRSFRFLFVLFASAFFCAAAHQVKQYFSGRSFPVLGTTKGWVEYGLSLEKQDSTAANGAKAPPGGCLRRMRD